MLREISRLLLSGLLLFGAPSLHAQTLMGSYPVMPAPIIVAPIGQPSLAPGRILPQPGSLDRVLGGFQLAPLPRVLEAPLSASPVLTSALAKTKPTNESVSKAYHQIESAAQGTPDHYPGLDAKQRRFLYHAVATHKVAGLDHLDHYDPTGEIGFCFGRAMAVHLIALRMGLAAGAIRKLFIVGDLRSGDKPEWRFHVTALVLGTDGAWYAVDPIFPESMEMSAWMRAVQDTWDKNRQAKLYVTPADVMMPKLDTVPDPGQETGERLIEVKFDPKGREGFDGVRDLPDKRSQAYDVDSARAQRYFDTAASGQGSFDFMRARVNGQDYDYRGYFADLTEAILSAPPDSFEPSDGAIQALGGAFGPRTVTSLPGRDLGSFRVRALLRK